MTVIRPADIDDAVIIRNLAEAVWWPTYRPILTDDQIRYMLDTIYDLESIRRQVTTGEQTYLVLQEDDIAKGFAAYSPRKENPAIYKLHKLYCLPETKGKGFGKLLLEAVEQAVKNAGISFLELNVNRYNPAYGFYEKMGFSTIYDQDIDIGGGYWMNDFVMRKIL